MFKRLLILIVLIYFAFVVGFLYAEPPNPIKPQPVPRPVYDIAITDMWLDENCQLCAKFENKGNTTIKGDIKGDVWFDTNNVKYFILKNFSLPPGQTYIWKGGSQFQFIGSHSVRITIDSDHQIAESDETNNTMNKSFNCNIKSQLPPVPVIQPDLIISEIKFQNIINKGNCEIFDVIIDVKNISNAISGPFKVLLEKKVEPYPDFKIACSACEIPVSGLAGGQTVSLPPRKFDTCGVVKKYIFRATADSNNSVAESNENNNSKTANYPAVETK